MTRTTTRRPTSVTALISASTPTVEEASWSAPMARQRALVQAERALVQAVAVSRGMATPEPYLAGRKASKRIALTQTEVVTLRQVARMTSVARRTLTQTPVIR